MRDSSGRYGSSQLLNGCCISQSEWTYHSCLEEREERFGRLLFGLSCAPWDSFVMGVRALNWSFWLEWELLLRGLKHFGCVGPCTIAAVVLHMMLKTPYLVKMCFLWWQEAGKGTLSCSIYIILCCSTLGSKGPTKQCFSPNSEFWETSCANCFFLFLF